MIHPERPDTVAPSATLDCPQCRATLTYYDVTGSYYYGCPNCHTYFKYENEGPPEILRMLKVPYTVPVVPIGAEGYVFGQWVRLVGYTIKRETGTTYEWREYYLLLHDGTYRSLSEYDGHWMWSEPAGKTYIIRTPNTRRVPLDENVAYPDRYVDDDEGAYRLFNKYGIDLVSAVGEFDYNLLDEARLMVVELILPPHMLIVEIDGPTDTWYKARYLEREELAQGFGLSASALPAANGVGAIQPNPVDQRWRPVVRAWSLGAVVALVLHLFLAIINPHSSKVLVQQFAIALDPGSVGEARTTVRSNPFQVNGPAHIGVDYVTDLDNHWAEFDADLVNAKTGQTYSFTKAIEYYQGVDQGESWSEGGKADDASLSRIPSGRYFLTIKPYTDAPNLSLTVYATAGPAPFSNVLVWVLLTGLYPLYVWQKGRWFEKSRWNQSDYNPADKEA